MSETLWQSRDKTVTVSRYVGPSSAGGPTRLRVQITVISDLDGRHHAANLSMAEFRALLATVRHV